MSQLMLMLLVCGASPCLAETAPEQSTESRWRLGAALGYGLRSNPLIQSDDIPIIVDFDIAWFGDHWFFDNGDLGLTLSDNALFTASIVARVNSDRMFFGNTDTRLSRSTSPAHRCPRRSNSECRTGTTLSSWVWRCWPAVPGDALQLSGFHDVSGTHDGYELYANYSYGWREQRLYIEPSLGVSYKSARLNNYYWGVTAEEGGIVVARYDATAGLNWHARLMLGYQLSRNWGISLVTEYERINDEAAASPIVDERNVLGFFAGLAYRF